MTALQLVSAQIGRVTGFGLAKNVGDLLPKPIVLSLVAFSSSSTPSSRRICSDQTNPSPVSHLTVFNGDVSAFSECCDAMSHLRFQVGNWSTRRAKYSF